MCLLCAFTFTLGCGSSQPSEQVLEARRLLQQRKVQQALDAISSEESAEGHYLKALCLHYLKKPDAAREQIESAIDADDENVKYLGFRLRLQLPSGKLEVADELIQLYEAHPSSAAAALFAFWAHGARRVWYKSRKQDAAAFRSGKAALKALSASITLCAEVPELQRELLQLAMSFGLRNAANSLIAKLREVAPEDTELLLAGQTDAAVAEAKARYLADNRSEQTAMLYAAALAATAANPRYDRDFRDLVGQYPFNAAIVSLFATYLAKSDRLSAACRELQESIQKQTRSATKLHLMRVAVYLPLEEGDADLAERQLNQYRLQIGDPLLITYFQGRLLYLRKDHKRALAKMRQVVEAQKTAVGSSRELAAEALNWIKRILSDQAVIGQLQKAADAVK